MTDRKPVLGAVLDKLDEAGKAQTVRVSEVVESIGQNSFAALMLIFALIAVSPASVVPGVTTVVAALEFMLVVQMICGRKELWLPDMLSRQSFAGARLRGAVGWLRRPVAVTDRLLRPRLAFLTGLPWLYPWLFLVLGLTLVMPLMEVVPGSGTLASSVIALVAAALLTRDGLLLLLAGGCLAGLIWLLGWLGGVIL